MKLSISEAARRAGIERTTLYRKIKSGELSKEIGADGKPVIELSELARVYPGVLQGDTVARNSKSHSLSHPENSNEITAVAVEVKLLRERIEALEADKAAAAEREGKLMSQLSATTRLLTDQREKPERDARAEELDALQDRLNQLEKRGFWDWFLGRKPPPPPRRSKKARQ